ncbi:HIT family protein [Patescibacteria group bacterium]|nr:HIT family protein [Patescibacteria group bacterium]
MNGTVFGKIIRGEIPVTKVYEDEQCLAFFDANPVTKGHTLLIPKEHFVWVQEVPDELLSYLFLKTKPLIHAMKKSLGCDYVKILVEGIGVAHFHIHLIPAKFNEILAHWNHTTYEEGEAVVLAQKISSAL